MHPVVMSRVTLCREVKPDKKVDNKLFSRRRERTSRTMRRKKYHFRKTLRKKDSTVKEKAGGVCDMGREGEGGRG